jgi:hypothetical protein
MRAVVNLNNPGSLSGAGKRAAANATLQTLSDDLGYRDAVTVGEHFSELRISNLALRKRLHIRQA